MLPMTPTPPRALAEVAPVSGELDPPSGGVGSPADWFLATCHRCAPHLSQPFRDRAECEDWAAAHAEGTGHCVIVSVDGDLADATHLSVVLRRTDDGDGYTWLCTTEGCRRWNDPRDTPQLALAMFREHAR